MNTSISALFRQTNKQENLHILQLLLLENVQNEKYW